MSTKIKDTKKTRTARSAPVVEPLTPQALHAKGERSRRKGLPVVTPPDDPRIEVGPNDPMYAPIPPERDYPVVVETFDELGGKVRGNAGASWRTNWKYADDIYRGIRGISRGASPGYNAAESVGWYVYGKPLKPEIIVPASKKELAAVFKRCGKAPLIPTAALTAVVPKPVGYCEVVAHLPKRGESLIIRVPTALFMRVTAEDRNKLLAVGLRERLLGPFVIKWNDGDPMMLKPILGVEKRGILGEMVNEEDVLRRLYPQLNGDHAIGAKQPPIYRSGPPVQPKDASWAFDPNAPEHELMKWDLSLLDVQRDLGTKAAFGVLSRLARDFGWKDALMSDTNLRGLSRWLANQERKLFHKLLQVAPSLRGVAGDASKGLLFSRTIIESLRGVASRVATTP